MHAHGFICHDTYQISSSVCIVCRSPVCLCAQRGKPQLILGSSFSCMSHIYHQAGDWNSIKFDPISYSPPEYWNAHGSSQEGRPGGGWGSRGKAGNGVMQRVQLKIIRADFSNTVMGRIQKKVTVRSFSKRDGLVWTSSQDGGVGECCACLLPVTTSKLQLNYRATITENDLKTNWTEFL